MLISKEDRALLKRMVGMLRPYAKKIAAVLACILASTGITMVFPQLSKQIMDDGLIGKDFTLVVKLSAAALVLVLLNQLIGLLETKYYAYINSIFQYSLLKKAFKHILRIRLHYFSNANFAEIMNNVTTDAANISRICDKGTFIIVSQAFRIAGGVTGLLIIDWRLTLLVLLICPAKYLLVKYLAVKRKRLFEEILEYNRDFSAWYGDTIVGVKEIKLWGIDRIKTGEFIKKQRNIVKTNIKLSYLDKFNEYSETVLYQIITNVLYILGAYMILRNDLSIGGLFAFITYSTYVTIPISAIINIGYTFSNVMPSAKRFFDFLDMETEIEKNTANPVWIGKGQIKGNIKFDKVSFSYDKDGWGVRDLTFEINAGEKVAIVGANGSGKSTLINLLLRFYKPEGGRILIDGTDINRIRLRDYRSLFSVVCQDLYLFSASIEENIAAGPKRDELHIRRAAENSGASGFIEELPMKFKTDAGRNGSRLSGGQRQKIAVARAFAKEAEIFIFDEATSNYDNESENYLNSLLCRGLENKTVFIISHNPDILKNVDKILLLQNGGLVEYDNYSEMENDKLKATCMRAALENRHVFYPIRPCKRAKLAKPYDKGSPF